MNPKDWTDIAINRVDESRTVETDRSGTYEVYLELSADPPAQWTLFFEDERSIPRHSMWRRARLVGSYIVITCPIDELKPYHIPDLKQSVASANRRYREWLLVQQQQQAQEEKRQEESRKRLRDALEDLDLP